MSVVEMLKKFACICFLCFFIPACKHKKSLHCRCLKSVKSDRITGADQEQALTLLREWEVTLLDIPFPLGALPVSREHTQETDVTGHHFLAYSVALPVPDLITFYEQEMERLGWQKMTTLSDFETILIFVKPDRICSISLRAGTEWADGTGCPEGDSAQQTVVISVGKKTQALGMAQEPGNYDEELFSA